MLLTHRRLNRWRENTMRRRVRCLFHPAFLIAWLPTDTRYFRCSVVALSLLCRSSAFASAGFTSSAFAPKLSRSRSAQHPTLPICFRALVYIIRRAAETTARDRDGGYTRLRRMHSVAVPKRSSSSEKFRMNRRLRQWPYITNAQGHCDDQVAIRPCQIDDV